MTAPATISLTDGVLTTRLPGSLAPGLSCYLALSLMAREPAIVTNHVSVSASTDDPNVADNVATALNEVRDAYGINVVRNPGAEAELAPMSTGERQQVQAQLLGFGLGFSSVPGWWVTSNLTVRSYGSGADVPGTESPGPHDRGTNLFTGGCCGLSTADQWCDLSVISAAVQTGGVRYEMSAHLGGVADCYGQAWFRVQFLDFLSTRLGEVLLGPVTPDDRTNATALLLRSATGFLPRQTRAAQFTVVTTGGSSVYGVADNVSFVLFPPDAPRLEALSLGSDHLTLSWPTNSVGFVPQRSVTLLPDSWTIVGTDPTLTGAHWSVVLERSETAECFRLYRP